MQTLNVDKLVRLELSEKTLAFLKHENILLNFITHGLRCCE